MPYILEKKRGTDKYFVKNKATGQRFSKNPLPKSRAERQMRAIYYSENKK
jgi:hypothetical protein